MIIKNNKFLKSFFFLLCCLMFGSKNFSGKKITKERKIMETTMERAIIAGLGMTTSAGGLVLTKKISSMKQKIKEQASKINEKEEAIKKKEDLLKTEKEHLSIVQKESEILKKVSLEKEAEAQEKQSQQKLLEASLQKKSEESNENLEKLKKQLEEKTNLLENKEKIKEKEKELGNVKNDYTGKVKKEKVKKLEREINKLKRDISKANDSPELKEEIERLRQKIQEEEKNELDNQKQLFKIQFTNLQEEKKKTEEKLQNKEIELKQIQSKYNELEKAKQEKERELSEKNDQLNSLMQKKSAKENDLGNTQLQLEALASGKVQQDNKLIELEGQISEKKEEISKIKDEITNTKSQLTDCQDKLSQKESEISELKEDIKEKDEKITDLSTKLQKSESKKQRLVNATAKLMTLDLQNINYMEDLKIEVKDKNKDEEFIKFISNELLDEDRGILNTNNASEKSHYFKLFNLSASKNIDSFIKIQNEGEDDIKILSKSLLKLSDDFHTLIKDFVASVKEKESTQYLKERILNYEKNFKSLNYSVKLLSKEDQEMKSPLGKYLNSLLDGKDTQYEFMSKENQQILAKLKSLDNKNNNIYDNNSRIAILNYWKSAQAEIFDFIDMIIQVYEYKDSGYKSKGISFDLKEKIREMPHFLDSIIIMTDEEKNVLEIIKSALTDYKQNMNEKNWNKVKSAVLEIFKAQREAKIESYTILCILEEMFNKIMTGAVKFSDTNKDILYDELSQRLEKVDIKKNDAYINKIKEISNDLSNFKDLEGKKIDCTTINENIAKIEEKTKIKEKQFTTNCQKEIRNYIKNIRDFIDKILEEKISSALTKEEKDIITSLKSTLQTKSNYNKLSQKIKNKQIKIKDFLSYASTQEEIKKEIEKMLETE